jgi:hypothetical protein
MGDGFSVMPAHLRRSGTDMADVAGGVEGRAARVRGDSSVWGSDEEGAAFGSAHSEMADAVEKALGSLFEELNSIGGRLAEMADSYEQSDQRGAAGFGQIGG